MLMLSGCSGEEAPERTEEATTPPERTEETTPERTTEATTAAAKPEPAPDERAAVVVPEPIPPVLEPVPPVLEPVPPVPVAPVSEPQLPPPSGITPEQAENRRILAEREATYDGTGPSPWV